MLCLKCKVDIDNDSIFCKWCGKKQVSTPAPKPLKRANGTGSVYKLSGRRNKPWVAFYKGKPLDYFEQKSDALRALERALMMGIPDQHNATVEDMYKQWHEANYSKLSKTSKDAMDTAWVRLSSLKDMKMRELRKAHLQPIINDISNAGLSRSVCEKFRTLVSHICRIAMENEIIDKNYARLLDLPSEDKKEKEIFTKAEIKKLAALKESETAKLILTMAFCGARPNELFYADVQNFHFGKYNYFIGGSKTKAGKNRIIPLHDSVIPFVKELINGRTKGYLVLNSKGGKMDLGNWRDRQFYPTLELAGIKRNENHKLTPYSCRHTFATNMMRNKTRPEILSKIIGHEDYETTVDNYGHVTDEDIAEMCDAVSSLQFVSNL